MNSEHFIGIYCNGSNGKHLLYSYNEIKTVKYIDFIDGRSDTLDAVFRVSHEDFGTGKSVKWELKNKPALYIDSVRVKPNAKATVIYDVVSDMMVECALSKQAKVLRVKIEKDSIICNIIQQNGYELVGKDDNYKYLEVDVQNY